MIYYVCGRFYESYNTMNNAKNMNDCCPICMNLIQAHIECMKALSKAKKKRIIINNSLIDHNYYIERI